MSNTDYAEPDIQRQDGANTAKTPSILIAGVGNIFLGDDAFGVEVVHRLLRRRLPVEVEVSDFGIRGLDLAYALLDPYDVVILVDALPRGGRPGTVYVLEPSPEELAGSPEDSLVEAHALDPVKVLRLVAALGGQVRRLLVVGCEPQSGTDRGDMQMGLSDPVRGAVDEAISVIESLVTRLLA